MTQIFDAQRDQVIFARAGADDWPPQNEPKPGPFRIVQRALSALRERIDELTRRADALNASRAGWFARLDALEAKFRHLNKRVVGEASPPTRLVIEVGPEETSADGGVVRRFRLGDLTFYVAVATPAPSPSVDDETAPFDPYPKPEITLEGPVYDSNR